MKEMCDIYLTYTRKQNDQQKSFDKNKAWMNNVNGDYLVTRLKKLPTVSQCYKIHSIHFKLTTVVIH